MNNSKVVCLDPGHGGKDRWNIGPTGYIEADGVLDIALNTRDFLEKHGVKVIMTRTTDANLHWEDDKNRDLKSRAKFANANKADFFISIHSNAAGSAEPSGTETFCLAKGGQGEMLAKSIQTSIVNILGTKDRGVKEANFAVLRETDMPAALVEVAFHSNPTEEELLKDAEFRKHAGIAIAKGICEFLGVALIEPYKPAFSDIVGNPNREAIELMAKLGVVKGFPDGSVQPDRPVTLGLMCELLARYHNKKE